MVTAILPIITAVNPARAGMIPIIFDEFIIETGKPRASGDDPLHHNAHFTAEWVNPARAGMIRTMRNSSASRKRKPRASGDDPDPVTVIDLHAR